MATNPFFSGRIPQELYDAIELHRKKSGESKTDVLIGALSSYVNLPVRTSIAETAKDVRLESIESRMTRMEEILASLQPPTSTQAPAETVQGQMSIDDISINDNNSDNSKDNEVLEDNTNVIKLDKTNDDAITSQAERWTTSQIIERLGVPRGTFQRWEKDGKLPRNAKGYTIIRLIGKRKVDNRSQNVWEVRREDFPPDEAEDF